MSRIREYRSARDALEWAVAGLQARARDFTESASQNNLKQLLAAGREYGRALGRIERMRGRK